MSTTTLTTASLIPMLLKEMSQEAETTRKMLSRVPDGKYDWKPHEKSMTIKMLATHIAELPSWVKMAIETSELDFAANPYDPVNVTNNDDLMAYFEKSYAEGREALENTDEEELEKSWVMRNGEEVYMKTSKAEVIRMTFSQIVHHRAQMGVFLRLLNIPIPGSYGPSADEMNF